MFRTTTRLPEHHPADLMGAIGLLDTRERLTVDDMKPTVLFETAGARVARVRELLAARA